MNIDNWLSLLEKNGQADIPMDFGGVELTPRQYVTQVKSGQMSLADAQKPSSVFGLHNLLKTRFTMRYNQGKLIDVCCVGADGNEYCYTPEEQMAEVNNNTKMGERFLLNEKALMDELKSILFVRAD